MLLIEIAEQYAESPKGYRYRYNGYELQSHHLRT